MSRAWMAQLLLMPLFVISQETCSSVTCSNNPGDPGNARLGNDTTALLHFQVASTTTTTLPACVAEINTGDCNAMSACKCEPDINPQPIGDFPDTQGTLQCGGKLSCNSQSASNTNFFRMNTPSPLECSGQNSCQIDFNVENIGSMCVTGDNAVGPSSQAGTYKLADPDVATGRVNDVCCAREVGQNQPTCKSPTFENVGSFFCTGDVSCDNVQATLSGDFYCRSLQGCGDQTNPPNDDEYWQWTTSGKHCIRCQSTDPGLDQGSPAGDERQVQPQILPTAPSTGSKPKEFEMGWDETLFRPWRKEILSANQRGPIELGLSPTYDPNADPDAPIVCKFRDGTSHEVAHITMADLGERTGKKRSTGASAPRVGASPDGEAAQDTDWLSKHPDLEDLWADAYVEDEKLGALKASLKSQKGRNSIASLQFKPKGGTTFSQKLQVVVKPPEICGVDAMAILKVIMSLVLDGDNDINDLMGIRNKLVDLHTSGKFLNYLYETWEEKTTMHTACEKRLEMAKDSGSGGDVATEDVKGKRPGDERGRGSTD